MLRWIGWFVIAFAIFNLLRGKMWISGTTRYGTLGGRVKITSRDDGWFFWMVVLIEFALGVFLVAR